jgi:predicted nucleic acid-binding protein
VIVIDASALAKYLLREEGWEEISHHIRREQVYSVDHVLKEVLNAIWKHCCLRGFINVNKAKELYECLKKLVENNVVIIEDEKLYLDKALEIALENHITVYDSLYIAQAISRRVQLLTSDALQAKIAKRMGVETILV